MPLELRGEPGGVVAPARGGAAPVYHVALLLPGDLHVVDVLQLEVDGVPAVGVPPGAAVVVVARDADVEEAAGARGAEDGVQRGDGAPVGEEEALVVVLVWVRAEVERRCGGRAREGEVGAGARPRGGEVVGDFGGEGAAQGGEYAPRGGARRAAAPPCLPDAAGAAPVWAEGPVEHGFDASLKWDVRGEERGAGMAYLRSLAE